VESGDGHAKFWLAPNIYLASSHGFHARDLAEISKIVKQNQHKFVEAWNDFFSSKN
jgi:hypothetical protein